MFEGEAFVVAVEEIVELLREGLGVVEELESGEVGIIGRRLVTVLFLWSYVQ